ncbi:MAG: hypothetical protein R3B45_11725 [Bdellovibrionota bacterium]
MSRILALIFLLIMASSCRFWQKNTSKLNSASSVDISNPKISLTKFSYTVDSKFNEILASRIGCEKTAHLLSYPSNGNLPEAIHATVESEIIYDAIVDNFFNLNMNRQPCINIKKNSNEEDSGLKAIVDWNDKRDSKRALTIVTYGDLGDFLNHNNLLDPSIQKWFEYVDQGFNLDLWQLQCSNDFTQIERCSGEMLEEISRREDMTRTIDMRNYLFWGYGRGGNIILDSLRRSDALRKNTVGVITINSPLVGNIALDRISPQIESYGKILAEKLGIAEEHIKKLPPQILLALSYLNNEETTLGKFISLLSESEIEAMNQGISQLSVSSRLQYLKEVFFASNFYSNSWKDIPVYHFASILDIARLSVVEKIGQKDQKVDFVSSSLNFENFISLLFSRSFIDYPFSNAFVAIQHSVIPRQFIPTGLKTKLVGLFLLDHFASRFSKAVDADSDSLDVDIVDAILSYVVEDLESK